MNTLSSGYRPFIWPWFRHYLSPSTYYYWLKYKIQRAQRGWADCDTWRLDNYLSSWLPDALRYLKEHKRGTPCSVYTEEELMTTQPDGLMWPGKEADARASNKWNAILDKMIAGFDAYKRMQNGLYEEELGPYPIDPDFFKNINNPSEEKKERFRKSQALQERDLKIFQEGAALFIEYFGNLWD